MLTTRELDRLIRADHIDPKTLKDAAFDTRLLRNRSRSDLWSNWRSYGSGTAFCVFLRLITGKNRSRCIKQIRGVNKTDGQKPNLRLLAIR